MLTKKDLYSAASCGRNPYVVKKHTSIEIEKYLSADMPELQIDLSVPGKTWNATPPGVGKTTTILELCKNTKTLLMFPNKSLISQNKVTIHPLVTKSNVEGLITENIKIELENKKSSVDLSEDDEFDFLKQAIESQYKNIELIQLEKVAKMSSAELAKYQVIVFDEFQMLVEDSYRDVVEPLVEIIEEQAKLKPVILLSATLEDNMIMFDIDNKISSNKGFPAKDIHVVRVVSADDTPVKKSTRVISTEIAKLYHKHKDSEHPFRYITIFNSDSSNERVAENLKEYNLDTEIISSGRFSAKACPEYMKMLKTKNSASMKIDGIVATGLMESGVSDLNPNAHVISEQTYPAKMVQRAGRTRLNNVSTVIIGSGTEELKFEYAPFIENKDAARDLGLCNFDNRILAWLCDTSSLMQSRAQKTRYGEGVLKELEQKYNFNVISETYVAVETQGVKRGSKSKFVEAYTKAMLASTKFSSLRAAIMEETNWSWSVVSKHLNDYTELAKALKKLAEEYKYHCSNEFVDSPEFTEMTISLIGSVSELYHTSNQEVTSALIKLSNDKALSAAFDYLKDIQADLIKAAKLHETKYQTAKKKSTEIRKEYKDKLKPLKDQYAEEKSKSAGFKKMAANILNVSDTFSEDEVNPLIKDYKDSFAAHEAELERLGLLIATLDKPARDILEEFHKTAKYPLACNAAAEAMGLNLVGTNAMALIKILCIATFQTQVKEFGETVSSKTLQRKLAKVQVPANQRKEFIKFIGKSKEDIVKMDNNDLEEFSKKFFIETTTKYSDVKF